MLKNKTLEFKSRYSSLSNKRQVTPQSTRGKWTTMNGFSEAAAINSNQLKKSRKMAKVQSTAFLRSIIKPELFNFNDNKKSYAIKDQPLKKMILSQVYQDSKRIKIENPPMKTLKKQSVKAQQAQVAQKSKGKSIRIKELPDIETFFLTLTPRSLFFCCKCFRYIFAIQKTLHHPKCQNQIDLLQTKEKTKIGWQKLNMILQLSQYTKHRSQQIQKLFEQAQKDQFTEYQNVQISQNVTYFRFEQIIEAFVYAYQKLIRENGSYGDRFSFFNVKKMFLCAQPNFQASSVLQKKLFK